MRIMWKEIAWMGIMLVNDPTSALLEVTNREASSKVQRPALIKKGVGKLTSQYV